MTATALRLRAERFVMLMVHPETEMRKSGCAAFRFDGIAQPDLVLLPGSR